MLLADEEKHNFLSSPTFLTQWWNSFTLSTATEFTWKRTRTSSIS
jgi:hypothetical protein